MLNSSLDTILNCNMIIILGIAFQISHFRHGKRPTQCRQLLHSGQLILSRGKQICLIKYSVLLLFVEKSILGLFLLTPYIYRLVYQRHCDLFCHHGAIQYGSRFRFFWMWNDDECRPNERKWQQHRTELIHKWIY